MDEITTAYQGSIIKEKHTFNELEIITELTLLVNMTSHFDYKCEFLFDDIGYCNDIISIQFVGMFVARKEYLERLITWWNRK